MSSPIATGNCSRLEHPPKSSSVSAPSSPIESGSAVRFSHSNKKSFVTRPPSTTITLSPSGCFHSRGSSLSPKNSVSAPLASSLRSLRSTAKSSSK